MKEQNKVITFIKSILNRIIKKDSETEKRRSDEMKREMCRRAIQSNVCPNTCKICAWNVKEVAKEYAEGEGWED